MKKIVLPFVILLIVASSIFAQKLKVEDVLAKHLNSIGSSSSIAAVKNQIAIGDVSVTSIAQKNLTAEGRVVFASEGEKNFLGMKLNANDYPLEKFTFDGKKAKVAYVRTGVRSILGNFVLSNSSLLEESLLGGVLSSSWVLLKPLNNKAKISYEGEKKIDGKEFYVLSFSPKNGGDFDVKMYFDKQNFQHVRTEYRRTASASIGRSIDESARQNETRLKITEDFFDFKQSNGLTLPFGYKINYSVSGQNGTTEIEWKFKISQIQFNQNLDPKTFDAESK